MNSTATASGRCPWDFWNASRARWSARAIARNRRLPATTPVSTTASSRSGPWRPMRGRPVRGRSMRADDVDAVPRVKHLGLVEYEPTWRAMQKFTDDRGPSTPDEIWLLEHPPVFTLGLNAKREHVLSPGGIPVVQIDRGGQVTYHGPGQLVVYPLVDLRRAKLGVRDIVTALEQSVIQLASDFGIAAETRRGAPGIYVGGKKLGSVGIRIRRHSSYHGL